MLVRKTLDVAEVIVETNKVSEDCDCVPKPCIYLDVHRNVFEYTTAIRNPGHICNRH